MEKLNPKIHHFLISTTSRFTDVYESESIRICHAWPSGNTPLDYQKGMAANPYSRNYFVISLDIDPPDDGKRRIFVPSYLHYADEMCGVLSILFGKRFDNHGPLFTAGQFYVPSMRALPPTNYHASGPNNHKPRVDLAIPLELREFRRVASLFTVASAAKFQDILFAAARFYLRSLQMFDVDPEFSYLDLITCGEILANFDSYSEEEVYDAEILALFRKIETEMEGGAGVVARFRGGMRGVKRKYVAAILRLLKSDFFNVSETNQPYGALRADDIEKRVKAAYDLRSQYVHSGVNFGQWTHPHGNLLTEIQLGQQVIEGKTKLAKTIAMAPTYHGLERIMRYCLLRFIHLNGVSIDERLDGPGLSPPMGAEPPAVPAPDVPPA